LGALSLALDEPDDYYSPPLNKRAIKKLHSSDIASLNLAMCSVNHR